MIQQIKRRFQIIGNSKLLNRAIEIAIQVAPTDMSVLITGKSGSGKESFSKIIHALSKHKNGKFIAINCGAIPEGTIDSELFGHEKGAYTGAEDKRKGYFEEANGGTIFLDEIGEMPLSTQARVLRVLEQGEFIRVGSSKVLKTDVRIVVATNVDFKKAIQKKKFREDLYYRLNTVPIYVPPLRERGDDINLLFRKFAQDFAHKYNAEPIRLTDDANKMLLFYDFPGNVRELKNLVNQMSILEKARTITITILQKYLPDYNFGRENSISTKNLPVPLSVEDKNKIPAIMHADNINILYRIILEMKKEILNLRTLLLSLIKNNNLSIDSNMLSIAKNYINTPNFNDGYNSKIGLENELSVDSFITKDSSTYKNEKQDFESFSKNFMKANIEKNRGGDIGNEDLSLLKKEEELIKKALTRHDYKRKNAAKELGISERTLYRKLKLYGIDK